MSGVDYAVYQPRCSAVNFKDYSAKEAADFDPTEIEYLKETSKDAIIPWVTLAAICLLLAILLIIWSCIMCCLRHEWLSQPAYSKLYEGSKVQRIFSLVLLVCIVVLTLLIIAMCAWGIAGSMDKVGEIIPESFDTIELLNVEANAILDETQEVVDTGNKLMVVLGKVSDDLNDVPDPSLAPTDLATSIESAKTALDSADTALDQASSDILDTFQQVLEKRAQGDTTSKVLVAVVVVLFAVVIVVSLVVGSCTIAGKYPRMTYCWVVFMWIMLMIGFILVAVFHLAQVGLSKTCLYMDDYAVRKAVASADPKVPGDAERLEDLVRYYFQPVGSPNKTSEEVNALWKLPLDDILESVDTTRDQLFTKDGELTPEALRLKPDTQQALEDGKGLFPELKEDIQVVSDHITGETLNKIHENFKDLICCTYHGGINSVYAAWMAAAIAGLILAILVSAQVCVSANLCQPTRTIDEQNEEYVPAPAPAEDPVVV